MDIERFRNDILNIAKGPIVYIKVKPPSKFWEGHTKMTLDVFGISDKGFTEVEKKAYKRIVNLGDIDICPKTVSKSFRDILSSVYTPLVNAEVFKGIPCGSKGTMIEAQFYPEWVENYFNPALGRFNMMADQMASYDHYNLVIDQAKEDVYETIKALYRTKANKKEDQLLEEELRIIRAVRDAKVKQIPSLDNIRERYVMDYSWQTLGSHEEPFDLAQYQTEQNRRAFDLMLQNQQRRVNEEYERIVIPVIKQFLNAAKPTVDKMIEAISQKGDLPGTGRTQINNMLEQLTRFNILNNSEIDAQIESIQAGINNYTWWGLDSAPENGRTLGASLRDFQTALTEISESLGQSQVSESAELVEV
jgi:hypothetical protein